jgi:hypothetical protein
LFELFSDPWRAYQTPVDTFVPYLIRESAVKRKDPEKPLLSAFSMEPAVIIQSKDLASDIQTGIGSSWKGLLADSTWDRILRDEEQDVKQLQWDDIKDDPAIKPRPWGSWSKKADIGSTLPPTEERSQGLGEDAQTGRAASLIREPPILQIIEQPKALVEEVDQASLAKLSSPDLGIAQSESTGVEEAPKHQRSVLVSSVRSGLEDALDDFESNALSGRPHRSKRRRERLGKA